MAPRKSKKAPETTIANPSIGTLTFGEPTPFSALPPKDATLPGYAQIDALEASTYISISGGDEEAIKSLVKKVQRNNKGRKYDVRAVTPIDDIAAVNVYRIA